jgi:hypothetical protein
VCECVPLRFARCASLGEGDAEALRAPPGQEIGIELAALTPLRPKTMGAEAKLRSEIDRYYGKCVGGRPPFLGKELCAPLTPRGAGWKLCEMCGGRGVGGRPGGRNIKTICHICHWARIGCKTRVFGGDRCEKGICHDLSYLSLRFWRRMGITPMRGPANKFAPGGLWPSRPPAGTQARSTIRRQYPRCGGIKPMRGHKAPDYRLSARWARTGG